MGRAGTDQLVLHRPALGGHDRPAAGGDDGLGHVHGAALDPAGDQAGQDLQDAMAGFCRRLPRKRDRRSNGVDNSVGQY